jgi:hypothetical protein
MNDQRARQILHSLVNEADPFTGTELSVGTVLQEADVLRALLAGCSALDERAARAGRRAQLAKNIGKAWTPSRIYCAWPKYVSAIAYQQPHCSTQSGKAIPRHSPDSLRQVTTLAVPFIGLSMRVL